MRIYNLWEIVAVGLCAVLILSIAVYEYSYWLGAWKVLEVLY
jgi:hypothetical protein